MADRDETGAPTEYPAGELMSAGKHGNGNGGRHYYKVEVRSSYHQPTVLPLTNGSHFVIDHCWRSLTIHRGGAPWASNIPVSSMDSDGLDHGLVTYIVAEAHRW